MNYDYEQTVFKRAYDSFKQLQQLEELLEDITEHFGDYGWQIQAVSYQIFKQEGVFELYCSDEKLGNRFISDLISDAFYQSNSLNEFYDKLTYIMLQLEAEQTGDFYEHF